MNMGAVKICVGYSIGVVIRAVLSTKLPISRFLEKVLQGKYLFDLIHFTAQNRLYIDLQKHIYQL